ncbi:MAG: GIY-YIG nuclease family protein [Candidatus Peribacter sp.]|jgi:putative endonuclease|nr:GIY-YIG nuclease family protein [Candidatus Peribacter sp.]MBT4393357.1 GIY-YIG nuclease family protein [Candidatus Peribacter sp.]MBT4600804.1 GIY-YIG nuclease family protein [Candidatus Peribacter sp.]MBT5149150.1 GIY-YIG nuclease family protein [Candidatus Peribacter sp.]MBT5637877.1 GIY-YIG nuclease family protein [Candidatus Peribacter sp.]
MSHYFYLARCSNGSLYSGYCKDLKSREEMHNSGKGAKYTRAHLPVKIIYSEEFDTVSEALKREAQVKKFPKSRKEELINM